MILENEFYYACIVSDIPIIWNLAIVVRIKILILDSYIFSWYDGWNEIENTSYTFWPCQLVINN